MITREIINSASSPANFDYGPLLQFESYELAGQTAGFKVKKVVKLNSVKVGLETNPRKDSEITNKVRPLTAKFKT